MKKILTLILGMVALAAVSRAAEAQVIAGSSITISVSAEGTAPFTYQWQKDGVDIPKATAATYVVASAVASDAGNYTVKVANKAGQALSDTAAITLIIKPAKVTTAIATQSPGEALTSELITASLTGVTSSH